MNGVQKPAVGVRVCVLKEGKVLLGKRRGTLTAGGFEVPEGYLAYGESFQSAAARLVARATGLSVRDVSVFDVENRLPAQNGEHVVVVSCTASWVGGEPENMESGAWEYWDWIFPANPPPLTSETLRACLVKLAAQNFQHF